MTTMYRKCLFDWIVLKVLLDIQELSKQVHLQFLLKGGFVSIVSRGNSFFQSFFWKKMYVNKIPS